MSQDKHKCKHLSWYAVWVGALVALGLTFLFNLLTLGLGLSLYTVNEQGMQTIRWGVLAWMFVGSYILLFISGWSAGKQICNGFSFHPCNGILHGFMSWVLYLMISVFLFSFFIEAATTALTKNAFINITLGQGTSQGINTPVPNQEAVQNVGIATLSTFLLFAIGALGSCIGAYCGIRASKECHDKCHGDKTGNGSQGNIQKNMGTSL